ncbi:MAG: hypothetical protein K2N52_01770, partial [Clostridia bacterium]|nr:hypothetical protein [Clostridia bacterium]
MAVAPVLERKINEYERESGYADERTSVMTEDERHNSKISANYAKLINPSCTLNDIIDKSAAPAETKREINVAPERVHVYAQKPYLVENARADADIFRADSAINRRMLNKPAVAEVVEEEENEDLRPTQATIQYRTAGVKRNEEISKIENVGSTKKVLTKKNKILIAAIVSVVLALFVLIIINSAIISGLGNTLNALDVSYNNVAD